MCEQKRRALQKEDKHVRFAYFAFNRFYELSSGLKTKKSYTEFCKSTYYNAFVKFGSFISNVDPMYPHKYIDYIVTSGVRLDNWCREELYDKYVLQLIFKEDATVALERSINTMVAWAAEHSASYNQYFRAVSPNRAVVHIKDGKISPWLLLNCKSGKKMLSTFNDEQLQLVYHIIDPQHWAMTFRRNSADVELVKDIAKKADL